MSKSRREKRKVENLSTKLIDLLGCLYEFLAKEDKPTDEEARAYFIKCDTKWKDICKRNKLAPEAYNAFKYEVAKVWNKKKEEEEAVQVAEEVQEAKE